MTFMDKSVFPTVWIAGFGAGTVVGFLKDSDASLVFPVGWLFGTLLLLAFVAPLKRVQIDGADLVVSNYIKVVRIPLTEIEDVTENWLVNGHPVYVHFARQTPFGRRIVFVPKMRTFNLFHYRIVSELKQLSQQKGSHPANAGYSRNARP